MNTPRILAALVATVVSLQASAMLTGEELYNMLKSGNPATKQAAMAYVQGFTDSNYYNWLTVKDQPGLNVKHSFSFFCPPPTVSTSQFSEMIVRYVEQNPKARKRASASVISGAIGDRWPCIPPGEK